MPAMCYVQICNPNDGVKLLITALAELFWGLCIKWVFFS